jgi:hypothetical protein
MLAIKFIRISAHWENFPEINYFRLKCEGQRKVKGRNFDVVNKVWQHAE